MRSPRCVALLLLCLSVATAVESSRSRSILADLVRLWDCSATRGHPVCGDSMFFADRTWPNGPHVPTARKTFLDFCALQDDSLKDPRNAKVPVAMGECPPPMLPLDCDFECPWTGRQSMCGVNQFGFQQQFGSLCELVYYNCRQSDERFHVIKCLTGV